MTNTKYIYEKKTNLTAGEDYKIIITENDKREIDNKAFNHLVIHNGTNQLIQIKLNDDANQLYPISSSGGRLIINQEDAINFQTLNIINTNSGAAATGDIYITIAYLGVA